MARRLVQLWSWLAVILPALIGFALLFNPAAFVQPGMEVEGLAHVLGLRNLALSLTLLVALLTQPKRVAAFLLIARGLSDIGDPLAVIIAKAGMTVSEIVPLVGAILTFACAYYWLKQETKGAESQS